MTLPDPVRQAIEAGYAVIPGTMSKVPRVPWKAWQTEPQTADEIDKLGHGSIWGLLTGPTYGLVVLDFDGPEGLASLASLGYEPHVRTPTGAHLYVLHPGHPVKTTAGQFPQYQGMDVRGDGGIAWFYGRSKKGVYTPLAWPPFPDVLDPVLVAELFPHPQSQTARAPVAEFDGPGHGEPEAIRYLERVLQDVETSAPGTSNSELNKAGFGIGGLVASGSLDGEWAYERLLQAAEARGAGTPDVVLRAAMGTGGEKPWRFEPQEDEWVPAVAYKMFRNLAVPEPVPFPVDVLPSPLDEFVLQGSASVSCPPDYLGAGLLPVLGIGIGGYIDLAVTETWRESALVYVTLVGPPGARKSPAIDLLMAPVWAAEGALEDVARAESEQEDWHEVEPPQIVVDDATIEALFGVLERNDRGVILQPDELTGWVGGMGQYKGGLGRDRQHWLSIWSRRPIKVSRVKARSRSIRRPFVTVLGGIQPEPLEGLLHGKDDGLLPRLLMARGEFVTPRLRRGAMDPKLLAQYDELWNRLRDDGALEETVSFTASGFDAFERWANVHYETLSKVPAELAGAWAKLDGQCARICLILARVLGSEVTPDVVTRAVALVQYFQGQAAGLLQGTSSGTPWEKANAGRMKQLARYIQDNPGATKGELMSMGPEWALDTRTLDRLLETLEEIGLWNG